MSVQSPTPMPAPASVLAIAAVLARFQGREEPGVQTEVFDLREVWAQITDPRDRRGRRHSLVAILGLVQAAVVSGATGFAAIRHWIGAAPQHVLAEAGARRSPRTGRYEAPHPDTVCRVLERLDTAEVDAAYARYQAARLPALYDDPDELVPVTVDGKSQRGTADGRGRRARHRLGAMLAQEGIALAQFDVNGKHNEITAFIPLLDQIGDIGNMVISADMMHTQREHARYLHRRGAHFVLPVGGNQPGLFDRLDALPWAEVPIGWMTYDRGHGRQEIRTIQVMPAPKGIRFPHVKQVFLIERHFLDLTGGPLSCQAVLGVTSLPAGKAGPRRLAELARGEWSIENRDHYVRDVTLGEDRCRVRTGAMPSILAVMRSHAISALRLLGFTNIAEATRWARDDFTHPLIALGLT
ncbi:IS4 family transposase [Actinomadura hallensis]|uniref:IS4 family transposase n=2 Tax=Actinomadura hallensis TaxID=337895 RepID=A0A543IE67_9ACTN|nr:ISAs1 family transposase [Saccharomonospora sp.]TQM68866.1 IS4 family transposase [Actinomadura hallensis]